MNSRFQPATFFLVARPEEALGKESRIIGNSSLFCFDRWGSPEAKLNMCFAQPCIVRLNNWSSRVAAAFVLPFNLVDGSC